MNKYGLVNSCPEMVRLVREREMVWRKRRGAHLKWEAPSPETREISEPILWVQMASRVQGAG